MADNYYGPTANYYVKPSPPSATPSWGADVVLMVVNAVATGVIREYTPATMLDPTKGWVLFRRAGTEPAATDEIVASVPPDVLAEVLKIERASTAVTPGAAQAKKLVDEDGNTLADAREVLLGDA